MSRKRLGPGSGWWLSGLIVVAMASGCEWVEPYEPLSRDPTTQSDASPQRPDGGSEKADATRDAVAGADRASGDARADQQGGVDAADAPGADAVPTDGTGADTATPDATTPDAVTVDASRPDFAGIDFSFPDFAIFLDGGDTCVPGGCPLSYSCCGCKCVQSKPPLVCLDEFCFAVE